MEKKILKVSELNQKMGLNDQTMTQSPKKIVVPMTPHGGVISKAEFAAQEKGQKLVDEAQREAERIKAQAQEILSQVKDEMERAKAQGYKEGREEGYSELTEEILNATKAKEEFFAHAEPEMIKLVMAIAEKIIGKLTEESKETVYAIVRQAIERSLGDRITVRINPEDLKRLKQEDLQFKDILDRTKRIHFKEDESIQKGGCVVETEVGTIDAQLETQLKAIRKALGV